MNTDKEDLLTLIKHKLRYLESPLQWLGVTALQPLIFLEEDYSKHFSVVNLSSGQLAEIPKEANLILFRLKGMGMAQGLSAIPQIMQLPGLLDTIARAQDRVVIVDDLVFSSATEIEQLEILAEVFYPKFFNFGHQDKAWMKLTL